MLDEESVRTRRYSRSSLAARSLDADGATSFSPRTDAGTPHLSQAIESRQLSSVGPDNTEGVIYLKEAEGIAF